LGVFVFFREILRQNRQQGRLLRRFVPRHDDRQVFREKMNITTVMASESVVFFPFSVAISYFREIFTSVEVSALLFKRELKS